MAYLARHLETSVRKAAKTFGSVLVTGPRQAGKTSLLQHLCDAWPGRPFRTISFDTPAECDVFRRDPDLFFLNNPGPLFLDEVQNVPDIFPYLKRELDRQKGKLRFFLSGSQHFPWMRGVSESLAGRVAVFDLWPLSLREIHGAPPDALTDALMEPEKFMRRAPETGPINDNEGVLPWMLQGGFPPMALEGGGNAWFESYRRTYLERDIRGLSAVQDLGRFDRFLTLCAGRSGTLINKNEFSDTLGVDGKTVEHWLSLLETSYQTVRLQPFSSRIAKRLVKRPKLLFADSGLALHLLAMRDKRALIASPLFGALFEAFACMEIVKNLAYSDHKPNLYYWRTSDGKECDLVVEAGGRLVPVEIKHTARPRPEDWKHLILFQELHPKKTGMGILISLYPKIERLHERVVNLPLGWILGR